MTLLLNRRVFKKMRNQMRADSPEFEFLRVRFDQLGFAIENLWMRVIPAAATIGNAPQGNHC